MLGRLIDQLEKHKEKVAEWLEHRSQAVDHDPVYCSVDIRNAGYKVCPVDTNIFPAGFNNLCPSYKKEVSKFFREYFAVHYPNAKKILILAEAHTRNTFYFESLLSLSGILEEAGKTVRIGSFNRGTQPIAIFTIERKNSTLFVDGFVPDIVLVNNDFSTGLPELIKKIDQPLLPTPHIGWHQRKKSDHFQKYCALSKEFAELIEIDPWLLCAEFTTVENISFGHADDMKKIALAVDNVIEKIRPHFREHNVIDEPFVFVKNNAGTYGMAIMTARSGDEFLSSLNKKTRTSMKTGKGGISVSDVIIQEGIPTIDRFKGLVAEPVIYLVHHKVCGGFFRLNEQRGAKENLNSPGMKFTKLCFHEMLGYSNEYKGECDLDCLKRAYTTVATLASIAAGHEILTVQT